MVVIARLGEEIGYALTEITMQRSEKCAAVTDVSQIE
jgi:hypothetical protein